MRSGRPALFRLALAAALAGGLPACASTGPAPLPQMGERVRTVHVMSNGWHAAIVLARAEVAATDLLPEAADLPEATSLEFGWGDRAYYPAEEATSGMALEAALVPTSSVMRVAGLEAAPGAAHPGAEAIAFRLTEDGFRDLVRAIASQFARPAGGPAEPLPEASSPGVKFYPARGRFHLFNTCNTWTARVLRAGGVGVSPAGIITADGLMARLRTAPGAIPRPTGRPVSSRAG